MTPLYKKHLNLLRTFPKRKLHKVIRYCFNPVEVDLVKEWNDLYRKLRDYNHEMCYSFDEIRDKFIAYDIPLYGFDLRK